MERNFLVIPTLLVTRESYVSPLLFQETTLLFFNFNALLFIYMYICTYYEDTLPVFTTVFQPEQRREKEKVESTPRQMQTGTPG